MSLERYPVEIPEEKAAVVRRARPPATAIAFLSGLAILVLSPLLLSTNPIEAAFTLLFASTPTIYACVRTGVFSKMFNPLAKRVEDEMPALTVILDFLARSGYAFLDALKRVVESRVLPATSEALTDVRYVEDPNELRRIASTVPSKVLRQLLMECCDDQSRLSGWVERISRWLEAEAARYASDFNVLAKHLMVSLLSLAAAPLAALAPNLPALTEGYLETYTWAHARNCIVLVVGLTLASSVTIYLSKPDFRLVKLGKPIAMRGAEEGLPRLLSDAAYYASQGMDGREILEILRGSGYMDRVLEDVVLSLHGAGEAKARCGSGLVDAVITAISWVKKAPSEAFERLMVNIYALYESYRMGSEAAHLKVKPYKQMIPLLLASLPVAVLGAYALICWSQPLSQLLMFRLPELSWNASASGLSSISLPEARPLETPSSITALCAVIGLAATSPMLAASFLDNPTDIRWIATVTASGAIGIAVSALAIGYARF